jgi:Na+/H+-dicarboxylate symporter
MEDLVGHPACALVIVPTSTTMPRQTNSAAKTISTSVTRGQIAFLRPEISASTALPTMHQNNVLAKVTARQVSFMIPFGTLCRLAGLAMMHGICTMHTGKSSA